MYLTDDIIEEVRSRNDIVDVISSYLKLQKKGSSYFAPCPFHNEKTGSFSVSGTKQMFYCFGCGVGGNVISFLMKYDNMTFLEAVKSLADRAGIALPDIELNENEKRAASLKNDIYEINAEAARYYHKLLFTDDGENARSYLLENRQLTKETITSFGLGVSGMRKDSLYRYFKQKGYKDEVLKETGLFKYNDYGVHDMFINRVMFPIINVNGKVIGFSGRVMGDGNPKYLNTPETPVFDKGRNLFGLNYARSSRKNNIIICEGNVDVISMHQAGFNQAVASCGTALTINQVMLLKRYTKDILVCYDNDTAGINAAQKAIKMFRSVGLRTKVINMSPYKDPDEFIKAEGPEAFQKRIDDAENSFLFQVRCCEARYDMQDPDGKTAFFNEVAQMLVEFEDEIERENYTEAVAAKYFINKDGLRNLVAKEAGKAIVLRQKEEARPVNRNKSKDDGVKKAQRMLLTMICDDSSIYGLIKKYITPDDFTVDIYREVAKIMFSQLEEGKLNPAAILDRYEGDDEQSEVAGILNTNVLEDTARSSEREKAINEAVISIKKSSLDERSRNANSLEELQSVVKEQTMLSRIKISLN